jgi:membrane-associated protein
MIEAIFAGYSKYYVLSGLALVEGPIASLASGFLVRLGYLNMLAVLIILVMGDVVSDTVYFFIVRKGNAEKYVKKFADKFETLSKNYTLLEKVWEKHGMVTMFLGKFAYGLMVPLIVSAALSKISYKKYMTYVVPATIFRYSVYLAIGYFLASSYQDAEKYIIFSAFYIPLIIAGFIVAHKFIIKFLRKESEV